MTDFVDLEKGIVSRQEDSEDESGQLMEVVVTPNSGNKKKELFSKALMKDAIEASLNLPLGLPDLTPDDIAKLTPSKKLALDILTMTSDASQMKDMIELLRSRMYKDMNSLVLNTPSQISSREVSPSNRAICIAKELIKFKNTAIEYQNMAAPLVEGYQRTNLVIAHFTSLLPSFLGMSDPHGREAQLAWNHAQRRKEFFFTEPDHSKIGLLPLTTSGIFGYDAKNQDAGERLGVLPSENHRDPEYMKKLQAFTTTVMAQAVTSHPEMNVVIDEYTKSMNSGGPSEETVESLFNGFKKIIEDGSSDSEKLHHENKVFLKEITKIAPKGASAEQITHNLLVGGSSAGVAETALLTIFVEILQRSLQILHIYSRLAPVMQAIKSAWTFHGIFQKAAEMNKFNWTSLFYSALKLGKYAMTAFWGAPATALISFGVTAVGSVMSDVINMSLVNMLVATIEQPISITVVSLLRRLSGMKTMGSAFMVIENMFNERFISKELRIDWLTGLVTPTAENLSTEVAEVFRNSFTEAFRSTASGIYTFFLHLNYTYNHPRAFIAQAYYAALAYSAPGLVTSFLGLGSSVPQSLVLSLFSSLALDGLDRIIANVTGSEVELNRHYQISEKFNLERTDEDLLPDGFKDLVNFSTGLILPIFKEGFKAMRYGNGPLQILASMTNHDEDDGRSLDQELEELLGVAASIALRDMYRGRGTWRSGVGFVLGFITHMFAEVFRVVSYHLITGSLGLISYVDFLPTEKTKDYQGVIQDDVVYIDRDKSHNSSVLAVMAGLRIHHTIARPTVEMVTEIENNVADLIQENETTLVFWASYVKWTLGWRTSYEAVKGLIPYGAMGGFMLLSVGPILGWWKRFGKLGAHYQQLRDAGHSVGRVALVNRRILDGFSAVSLINFVENSEVMKTNQKGLERWFWTIISTYENSRSDAKALDAPCLIVASYNGTEKNPEFTFTWLSASAKDLLITPSTTAGTVKQQVLFATAPSTFKEITVTTHPIFPYILNHLMKCSRPLGINYPKGTDVSAISTDEKLTFDSCTVSMVKTAKSSFKAAHLKNPKLEAFSNFDLGKNIKGITFYLLE